MIRPFKQSDTLIINEIGKELKKDFDVEKKNPLEGVIVYIKDEEVVGFLIYLKIFEMVEIVDVVVKKEERGKGMATEMLNYVFDFKDVQKSILEVSVNNTEAIKLYDKLGYKKVRDIKNYYGDGIDGISMERVKI